MAASGVDQLTKQARAMVTSLGGARIAVIAGVFLAVVLGIGGITYWASQPNWALLATDVEPEAMSGVIDRLKALKVDYSLDAGGRAVRVDASRVDELRMRLAAEGLPASGRIGFELFDRTTFGATELTEKVNFQRALEGELARTISSLSTVSAARVHLALPRNSLFAHESEPAKASVVLRLKVGRTVSAPDVDGIVALVASSVEGLDPSAVTIIDASGRRLSRDVDPASNTDRARLDHQQQLERDTAARVVALLEPVVGPGRVRANVSVALKNDSVDETEERWDPTTVVRSRQQTTEADGRPVAQSAAGARANLPPAAPDAKDKAAATTTTVPVFSSNNRSSEVTNYEVSKLTRHTIRPAGDIGRLSVAVLIDDVKTSKAGENGEVTTVSTPRSKEELQRLHALVASAVGLVPDRGDELTVDNIAFDVPDVGPSVPAPAPLPPMQLMADQLRQNWPVVVPAVGVVFLAIGGVLYLFRSRGRQSALPASAPAASQRLASAPGAPAGAPLAAESDEPAPTALPSPARQLARLAQAEPEQLARIVRGWLAEEERAER